MRAYLLVLVVSTFARPLFAQELQTRENTAPKKAAEVEAPARRLSLDFSATPLRDAVRLVFRNTGMQYTIDPNVPNVPIDLKVQDVSLQQALRLIVRFATLTVPNITVSQEMDIYLIRMRAAQEPERIERNAAKPFWIRSDVITEKIPLQHLDVAAISTALGGTVVSTTPAIKAVDDRKAIGRSGIWPNSPLLQPMAETTVFGVTADNSLVVLGTRADIDKLRQVIRFLDVPAGLYRVRISAGALSATGLTKGGALLGLSDAAKGDRLNLKVVARPGGEGVDVSIDGQLVVNGVSRTVTVHASLRPGVATPVVILGDGSRETRLWVKVELPAGAPKRSE